MPVPSSRAPLPPAKQTPGLQGQLAHRLAAGDRPTGAGDRRCAEQAAAHGTDKARNPVLTRLSVLPSGHGRARVPPLRCNGKRPPALPGGSRMLCPGRLPGRRKTDRVQQIARRTLLEEHGADAMFFAHSRTLSIHARPGGRRIGETNPSFCNGQALRSPHTHGHHRPSRRACTSARIRKRSVARTS